MENNHADLHHRLIWKD